MTRGRLVLSLLLVAGLAGCATTAPPPAPPPSAGPPPASLTNTRWKLTVLQGERVPVLEREIWILFEQGGAAMRGFAGCNTVMGTYRLADSLLAVTNTATTRMMCPEMRLEDELLAALTATLIARISGDTLELRSGGREVARFEAVYLR